jgi:hypothetical protein
MIFANERHDIKVDKNSLNFIFHLLTLLSIILTTVISISEPLVKNKSERNFFIQLQIFSEVFKFCFKRKINLKDFKKVLTRRLIFLVILPSIVGTIPTLVYRILIKEYSYIYLMFFYFLDQINLQLILYKFCFYVDLISLHLKCLKEIFENFQTPKLSEILMMKKLYVLILEVTREFNDFIINTLQFFVFSNVMWLMIAIFRLFEYSQKALEESGDKRYGEKLTINL